MDDHERGIDKRPGRLDIPLPEWKGSYGGDPRRLPRVVQKLVFKHRLTAEEKAELLWRLYELDQRNQAHGRRRFFIFLTVCILFASAAGWALLTQTWILQGVVDIVQELSTR